MADDSPWAEADRCMQRYAEGDDAAFVRLYQLLAPRLRAFLLHLGGNTALADEGVQETMLRLHRARGSFARDAHVLPWSMAIARNVHRDRCRRRTLTSTELHNLPGWLYGSSPDASPEQDAAAREKLDIVRNLLARMSVEDREALVLARLENLSAPEIAEVLGVSESSAKSRVFRAAKRFEACMRKGER